MSQLLWLLFLIAAANASVTSQPPTCEGTPNPESDFKIVLLMQCLRDDSAPPTLRTFLKKFGRDRDNRGFELANYAREF